MIAALLPGFLFGLLFLGGMILMAYGVNWIATKLGHKRGEG